MDKNKIEVVRNDADCIIVRHSSKSFVRLDYFTVFTTYCAPQMFTFGTLEDALKFVEFYRAENARKGGAQ